MKLINADELKKQAALCRETTDAFIALIDKQPNALVYCINCKHRPAKPDDYDPFASGEGFRLEFPDQKCPCQCDDGFYSWYPKDNFFCRNGEIKEQTENDTDQT